MPEIVTPEDRTHLKKSLRKSLLKTRQALSAEVWRQHSDRLCTQLQASALFMEAKTVLAFFSIRNEPDLSPLFALDKTWGFPRCVERSLSWHIWSPDHPLPLQSGTYGIPEPHPQAPTLDPETVDLVLVPAVACDRARYRLGYGGGFYDRLLSTPEWAAKPTIGITFAFAHVAELPIEPWDQPLQGVCTEAEFVFGEPVSG